MVGHGDIAPGRKVDPGPLFPWRRLALEYGVGAWYDESEVQLALQNSKALDMHSEHIKWLQEHLHIYGYKVPITGELDSDTISVIQAFQMHFRPADYSGKPDAETCAILANLIKKYFPKQAHKIDQWKDSTRTTVRSSTSLSFAQFEGEQPIATELEVSKHYCCMS